MTINVKFVVYTFIISIFPEPLLLRGGAPPGKQWLRKIEIIKLETPNFIFIAMHYPSSILR